MTTPVDDIVVRLLVAAAAIEPRLGKRTCLIGGLARDVWAEPRATQDVDVIIDAEDPAVVLPIAGELGLTYVDKEVAGLRHSAMTRLRLPEELTGKRRIDVIARSHEYYARVLDRSAFVDVFGAQMRIACAEDIVVLKTLAGRPQDLADIEAIIEAQGDKLDRDLIRRECTTLEIEPSPALLG